ncbi:MAG: aldehyde dehydrogenase family protein, partial [Phycisphaeraceae bacterium]|nr:aldehyde dehydrogenase family protein [Phycisphaeraceae bacterium]
MKSTYPLYLAGRPTETDQWIEVNDKYSGDVATRVARASADHLDQALAAADHARKPMAEMPPHRRQAILEHLVDRCRSRQDELAQMLAIEAGKPLQHATGEVSRLITTLKYAAGEAVRSFSSGAGEVIPMGITEAAEGYRGWWKRVPVGICSFITPFNFPLNLVAHKIGPALAVGCPFVLKPASATPVGALALGEMLAECDLPEGAFSILPMPGSDAEALATDKRVRKLSFTGSDEVGWRLKEKAARAHVSLELGGNAACIVDADANLDDAADRIIHGAFYQSGQSCISVQRILAHADIYDDLRD